MTQRRRRESGIVRGCCLLVVVALVLLGGCAYIADRAIAAPELGAGPQGPDHGSDQTAIAVSLGTQLGAELLTTPHAYVTLSEHDLTVLAGEHNPNPDTLSNVSIRVRSNLVVVSGLHQVGPLTVTAVAHMSVVLDRATTPPKLTSQVVQLDVGELGIPGLLRDRLLGSFAGPIDLDRLFSAAPALQLLRAHIECVAVARDGVRVGVHRPAVAPDPSICGS